MAPSLFADDRSEALAMTAFRHLGFQRAIALLLFAGASVACVPAASANATTQTAFESELRAALGDSEALELAIDAARSAPSPDAAVEAFVEAYVRATGDADAGESIFRLLQDHPNQFGAPAIPLNRAVWTTASSAVTPLPRAASDIVVIGPSLDRPQHVTGIRADEAPVHPVLRTLRTQQPRAP
ncbi:MAG: hypothetical protein AAF170_17795 [Bacteroidota bacterium]